MGFGLGEWHLPSLKGRLWCVNQGHPCPAIWDPCGKCPQGPARDSIIMKSSKSRSLGRACTFSRHSILQPSLNLLQVFRSKRGRQQLLDRPDYECAIRLGHVHGPVGAKLSHDLSAGSTGRDELFLQVTGETKIQLRAVCHKALGRRLKFTN